MIHNRAAGAKVTVAGVLLICLTTAHRNLILQALASLVLLAIGFLSARLPLASGLSHAAAILPFTAVFAAISWASGDAARALELVLKSYVCALAVLLLVATTPMPDLIHALERVRVPGFLLMVVQFLYRYLHVVLEEAVFMRQAAASRGGWSFAAAAGAIATLFARSHVRAEGIHRAMIARGFDGRFRPFVLRNFTLTDTWFAAASISLLVGARIAAEIGPLWPAK